MRRLGFGKTARMVEFDRVARVVHVVHDCGVIGTELISAGVGGGGPVPDEQSVEDQVWWVLKDSEIDFDLAGHVLRGHLPYSSSCEVCVRFSSSPSTRFIVIVHVQSFALGCVDGEAGRPLVIEGIGAWLLYFGLANVAEGVVLRCDAEPYIRTLLEDVLEAHDNLHGPIEQFNPSRHVPAAERGVRTLRELGNTLLADVQDHGVALRETSKCFSLCTGAVCMSTIGSPRHQEATSVLYRDCAEILTSHISCMCLVQPFVHVRHQLQAWLLVVLRLVVTSDP